MRGGDLTRTLLHHLRDHALSRPDDTAYAVRGEDGWRPTSYAGFHAQVRRVGRALIALGLEPGGTVGLLGFNRPEWTLGCLGAMAAGGAAAGIYQTCAPNQVTYILRHAESRVVVVESLEQWQKVCRERDGLPDLAFGVLMDGVGPPEGEPGLLSWQDFLARGEAVSEAALDARLAAIETGDLGTLIYTSGTTGTPKAVMLSHGNLLETARIGGELHGQRPSDCTLSYLPLAHIAEQMISVHTAVYVGYAVYYAEAPERLADNLREVEPTIFFGVPRVWERVHAAMLDRFAAAGVVKRRLVSWAMGVGRRVMQQRNLGAGVGGWLALQHRWAERLVTSKVRQRIGFRRVRLAASGAAPIRREVLEFYGGLGIRIHEVWGLSECCGPGTWNHAGLTRFGTVGPVLPEVEVEIAADGEVLLRGPNVFQGYLKNPEATAEALVDGWLYTGDVGELDSDGCLKITGRKKELIITSGGKNIAPAGIEGSLKELPLVGEAMVIGDGRRCLTALLTLEEEAAVRFTAARGLAGPAHEHRQVLAEVQRGVDAVNARHARVEVVRDFRLLPRPFSVEEDELTPTLKLKRRVIEKNWAAPIEEMYRE